MNRNLLNRLKRLEEKIHIKHQQSSDVDYHQKLIELRRRRGIPNEGEEGWFEYELNQLIEKEKEAKAILNGSTGDVRKISFCFAFSQAFIGKAKQAGKYAIAEQAEQARKTLLAALNKVGDGDYRKILRDQFPSLQFALR